MVTGKHNTFIYANSCFALVLFFPVLQLGLFNRVCIIFVLSSAYVLF